MWREFIQSCVLAAHSPLEIRYTSGASTEQIAKEEAELGTQFPSDLKMLFVESDGIKDIYGLGIVWSLVEISRYNREMRTESIYREHYMSFTDLLFFADAGNGDRFAFPIHGGEVQEKRIFVWNHEDDSRLAIASSLQSYLEGWLGGTIKL